MCRWGLGIGILHVEGKRAWACRWGMVGGLLGWNQGVGTGGVEWWVYCRPHIALRLRKRGLWYDLSIEAALFECCLHLIGSCML